MDNNTTTICVNGELKPGDLVLSTPDDYACLVGTVLSILKLGTPEHAAETENDTDTIHVNFMDADYSERRIAEIEEMFSDLYGQPMPFGECPIDDTIMSPDALIRITGIGDDTFRAILDSHEAAEALCKLVEIGPGVGHDARLAEQEGYMTERLYSPLFCSIYDKDEAESNDGGDYENTPISQQTAVYHEDAIHEAILRERRSDEEPRGLMTYYHFHGETDDPVDSKVRSLYVDVEAYEGKLWGVATLELTEPLTPMELTTLKDYLTGQYSDGFGEGFEQRGIKTDFGELYVSLWSSEDEFFIDTEREFMQRLGLKAPERETPAQAALHEPDIFDDPGVAALRERLVERLNGNLGDYFHSLQGMNGKEIASFSSEIAVITEAHYYLTEIHNFHTSELEYLLQFQNPLQVVADGFDADGFGVRSDSMWKIFDRQDALQGDYELMPAAPGTLGQDALKQELFDRLDDNMLDYRTSMLDASKEGIFDMAEEIAARYAAREYLKTAYDYKTGEVEYLLQFQDPLAVAADKWLDATDHFMTVTDVITGALEDKDSHGHYARVMDADSPAAKESARDASTEKRSVLEQIREAAKAPKEPRRDRPTRDKSGPEL